MSAILTHRSTHSGRLERWLGKDRIDNLVQATAGVGWYGPPIHILDLPGSVRIGKDGDFTGPFERGVFMTALDSLEQACRRAARVPKYSTHTGFTSISDALSRASGGFSRQLPFNKVGATGVTAVTNSLHKLGPQPIAGTAGSDAPGGRALVDSDTGGFLFDNPAAGSYRLTGADVSASVLGNTLLLYDRLFDVAKTMASTATQAVTGVPSRYQSTTDTAEDYIGGNFGFVEVGLTVLAATAHNWTTCLYTDQANASSTLPSLTGNSGAIVHRLDHPTSQWFAPLASGDVGIKDWTQMQCSASVATGLINFVIGHPLGFLSMPLANTLFPFDWLTNRNQAPRIFADAYLALLEICKPSATATTYTGALYMTSTSS
ncbi:MAG: hypothetical protein ABL879_17785 [Devosia sp.]